METTPFGNTLWFVSGALVFPNYENLFRHASGGISFLFPFFVIIVIITPPMEQYGLASYEVLEHFLPPLDIRTNIFRPDNKSQIFWEVFNSLPSVFLLFISYL